MTQGMNYYGILKTITIYRKVLLDTECTFYFAIQLLINHFSPINTKHITCKMHMMNMNDKLERDGR